MQEKLAPSLVLYGGMAAHAASANGYMVVHVSSEVAQVGTRL